MAAALAEAIEKLLDDPLDGTRHGAKRGRAGSKKLYHRANGKTERTILLRTARRRGVEERSNDDSMFGSERLTEILNEFSKIHLLVVGDLMLDRFIWGDVERLSPEAPVPVLRVYSESSRLGGAANVIHNVRSLGAQVTACGVVGADGAGKTLTDDLRRIGASTSGVFADREIHSIQKTRIIARPSHQQIVRLDRENHAAIRDATLKKICQFILNRASRFDADRSVGLW